MMPAPAVFPLVCTVLRTASLEKGIEPNSNRTEQNSCPRTTRTKKIWVLVGSANLQLSKHIYTVKLVIGCSQRQSKLWSLKSFFAE